MEHLLEAAKAIGQGNKDEHIKGSFDPKSLPDIVDNLSNNDIEKILKLIFGDIIPSTLEFYDRITDFFFYTGYNDATKNLIALLWVFSFQKISKENQGNFLAIIYDNKSINFWRIIGSLPLFCSKVPVDPNFAAIWFYELSNRVKEDLAGNDVFEGIKLYAINHPNFGLKVIEIYFSQGLNSIRLSLSSLILAQLRVLALNNKYPSEAIVKLDAYLKTNFKTEYRICYYRSFVEYFNSKDTYEELDLFLSEMIKGVNEEIEEAFNVHKMVLIGNLSNKHFIEFALNWLDKHSNPHLTDIAKHIIVNSIWNIYDSIKKDDSINFKLLIDRIILVIQPIPDKNKGTWDSIQYYLVSVLHESIKSFTDIFTELININPQGITYQLINDNFDYLISEMSNANIAEYIFGWMFSLKSKERILGFLLFNKISIISDGYLINKVFTEQQLNLFLAEMRRKPLLAEKTSSLLLLVEPIFRLADFKQQENFKNEMVIQAINYPGACLSEWEKLQDKSSLLNDVIKSAKEYFEKLNSIKDCPANKFTFPGYKRAIEKHRRDFSNQTSRIAYEKSVFYKLAKHVNLIYSSKSNYLLEGKLGKETDLKEFSASIEFPRLEFIDPEGMALRRIMASSEIKDPE